MKFFVDTADTAEIKSLASSGLLDGVTTNPSLIAKSGKQFGNVIAEICDIVSGPVSAEVAATDFDGMMAEARVLRRIAKNVAIKVPLTPDGLRTCRHLADDGVMVNVTLCFSPAQALLAAKAGAAFISPFVGRLDDIGQDGLGLIAEILLSVPAGSIAGGTDEIQRNIIAERVLRMPKEPSTDTDRPFRDVPRGLVG